MPVKEGLHHFTPSQFVLHIPHSSRFIPEKYRKLFYLTEEQLQEELLRMTDTYTDELFCLSGVPEKNRIRFPCSRLVCDVERFRDDRVESMAKKGMGICYTSTSDCKPLKQVSADYRDDMLVLYDHHHAMLTDAVNRVIHAYGSVILIDCHSFSSRQLPYEADGEVTERQQRPDICIGTDPGFHTPSWLSDYMLASFECLGYSVAADYPFSGTLVPMKHYHRDRRVLSVMIEINRSLYMDEKTGRKTEGFLAVREDIASVIMGLSSFAG